MVPSLFQSIFQLETRPPVPLKLNRHPVGTFLMILRSTDSFHIFIRNFFRLRRVCLKHPYVMSTLTKKKIRD